MRRTAAWKPIAGVAAATIAIAGFGVAPATAAPGDSAEALAEVLGAELLDGQDLAGAARALSGFPSDPSADFAGLELSLLGGDIALLEDGLVLPLLHEGENNGLLELGSAGALTSFAHADAAASATASAGVLDENGAIAFDANQEAPEGTTTASVDATALLDALGLGPATGGIVNELALELGAVAASAEEVDGVVTSDYRVADLTLELDSPAVGQLVSALNGSLDTVESGLQTSLDSALGETGVLNTVVSNLGNVNVLGLATVDLDQAQAVVGVPDLSAVVNTALSADPESGEIILSSDDGAVTINLTAGTVSLDVAALVGSIEREDPDAIGLNGFGPNTEILTPEVLSAITSGVLGALGGIVTPVTQALDTALETTTIDINIPLDVDLLPAVLGGVPVADGSININGSLAQIIDGDPTTISAPLTLLPIAGLAGVQLTPLTNAVVTLIATPILSGIGATLDGLLTTADSGVTGAVDTLSSSVTSVLDGLSPVLEGLGDVAQITINVQPAPPAPGTVTPSSGTESGDLVDGFTVRALTLTLLPNLLGSSLANLDFASASVSNVEIAAAGTLVLDPDRAHGGDVVDISGDGWTGTGDVTVTFTDAAGEQVGDAVVLTPVDGTIAGDYTVPAGTDPQTLTATAEQEDATTTAELEVVEDPTVIVDPDPVDPGETITISGSGFLCGPVTVTISDGATVLETIEDIAVAEDGTWSTTYAVPADIAANSLTITAVATGECGDEDETDVEIDQPESLALTPDRVRGGDAVAIAGDGWAQGSDVTVTFTDVDGATVGEPVVITPAADGSITGTFPVPAGAVAGVLTGTAAQGDDSSTDTVTVFTVPTVVVEPDPVDPGETITISGSGFLCGPVDVTIADGTTILETIEDVEVADDGTWSTTYAVPADVDATSLTITAVATGECGDEGETEVEVDQPETIALTPGEVRGGDEIAIDGDGWDADGGPVTVVFEDAAGNPVGEPVEILPGEDGTIDGTFEVPLGTPAGELTGTATQGDDETTDTVAVFDPASVSIEPGTVRAGADVTIDGGGWLPGGGDVTVTFEDADGNLVGEAVVLTPSATGTIDGTFTVPEGTDAGILTAIAVQGDDEATDTLAIAEEPSVTVEPDTARPGDVVTVGGGGWADGTPVTVTFTDADGEQVGDALSLDPTDGVIDGAFTVPADVEPGTLTATAVQGADEATDELEVTLAPTVSATPEQLHAGDAIAIGGTGWDPASVVTVTVTDADGAVIGTPLGLTPTTEGVITGSFTVPEGTELGELTVTAAQGADEATDTVEVVADPTVVVTPDPADPGQQVTISGDGFLCGPVTVTITAGDTVLATIEDLTVIDGQWSTVYTVPVDVTVDSLTISAVATGVCGDEGETDLEVDLLETLTASPAFAEVGDVVTLTGTGWADGAVAIVATDASGATVGTFGATAVEGSFSVPFTVPAGTVLGALEFEATQGDDVETATVSVVSIPAGPATLTVSPSTVEAGATVAIDGEGYDPTAGTVAITVRDASGTTVGTVTAAVQPDGALFRTAFQVPSTVQPQTLTATAVQGTRTASDSFAVRASNLPVVRLGGPDRFATAVEISRDAFPFGSNVVYLANGLKFPDALSAAPAAAQTDSPLLLTRQEYLEPGVIDEFDRLEPDVVVIVGDESSVSANVAAQVAPFAGEVVRLGGADRFQTSQLIAEYAFDSASTAYIATGLNFPDALTAGAAAGADAAPLLLTYGATPPAGLVDTLEGLGVDGVYIAGDGNAVATSQEAVLESAGIEILDRYAGENRFDTGVQVSQASFDGPADRIYVATGLRFPDALAGSAIAGAQGVPVFTTRPTCMWADILTERDRLGGPQVVLLGDQLALDNNVFDLQACTS